MTYMVRWEGKIDPDDKSGTAHFRIEGEDYDIVLPSFEAGQKLDQLMWVAFQQGKQFSFNAIKGHIGEALARADQAHALTMRDEPAPPSPTFGRDGGPSDGRRLNQLASFAHGVLMGAIRPGELEAEARDVLKRNGLLSLDAVVALGQPGGVHPFNDKALRERARAAWVAATVENMDPEHVFIRGYIAAHADGWVE